MVDKSFNSLIFISDIRLKIGALVLLYIEFGVKTTQTGTRD